jgi:hypothetical protein
MLIQLSNPSSHLNNNYVLNQWICGSGIPAPRPALCLDVEIGYMTPRNVQKDSGDSKERKAKFS